MSSPHELADALLQRRRGGRPAGEFPEGWKAWFAAMPVQAGTVTGAPAAAIVAVLAARAPAPPPRASGELNRRQAFAALLRPRWHASDAEPRRDRILAMAGTVGLHLFLLLLFAWLDALRSLAPPAPAGEDHVVQVEYIGEGTPEETGGGASEQAAAPPQPQPSPPEAASAPSPAAAAATPPPEPAPPQPEPEPVPAPLPQPEPSPQPLQVSEVPQPTGDFVLPPTTPPELQTAPPRPQTRVVELRERTIEATPRPVPPAIEPRLQPQPQAAPQPRTVEVSPRAREIPLLSRTPAELPQVTQAPAPAASVRAPARQVQSREIPLAADGAGQQRDPAPVPGSDAVARPAPPSGTAAPAGAAAPGGERPEPGQGDTRAANAGAGPRPDAAPGAWPTPQRGDDWGEGDRNRPGGNAGTRSGLFNADGSPKLPPGTAAPGGGFPPGSDDWTRDLLDRNGTWAKRPPLGYEPTRFDEYWIPSGTLLQEWVRRGLKTLAIPIPGSSKKINCTISILQLGGGCGISDANLQDQEATARPPPDIPYKPELQEGGAPAQQP